jgi:hypothetical protein
MSKIITSIITYEEKEYIKECIDGIYDFSDKIIIVHGSTGEKSDTDTTVTGEIIYNYPDPDNKLITNFMPESNPLKREWAFAAAVEEGFDWYMIVDADEFYTKADLVKLDKLLDEDKEHDMFFMSYFAFCFNWNLGYWDHVTPNYPKSERIWRWQNGLNFNVMNHPEVFFDKEGVALREKRCRKINLEDDDIMMYHMTWVKEAENTRRRMQARMGVDGMDFFDEILNEATADNLEEIYQKNKDTRGVHGIHWNFPDVVLSEWSGREMPEVLDGHYLSEMKWIDKL